MIIPALPVPLWVFNPFKYNKYEKGLKSTEEEALPLNLLNRLLKQTAKESLRHKAQLCLLAHIQIIICGSNLLRLSSKYPLAILFN